MKTYTLAEVQDNPIGKIGTPDRDKFEYELQMNSVAKAISQRLAETIDSPIFILFASGKKA